VIAAPRILVSAGEPSGDLHGAEVVRALRLRWPGARIDAVGGPRIAEAGARVRYPMERLSAIGLVEIVGKLPQHVGLYRDLRAAFQRREYDLFLPIDYPGFHVRVARAARKAGTRVLYYIPPQLWAWRPQRARQLGAAVDRLAVILPFEPAFFATVGLVASYVGHPLLDRPRAPGREAARAALGLPAAARVLAVFPGSRRQEVRSHWAIFAAAAAKLRDEQQCDAVIVAATPAGSYPDSGGVLLADDPRLVLAAADACLAKSGTTTLEAAMADVPMVVAYRANPLTYAVARRVMTVEWVSLVNLIAGREIVPELLQNRLTVDGLVGALRPLLDAGSSVRRAQLDGLATVRSRLGTPGAAGRVAELAAQVLGA
jgi:lipid-A-disaccharide synthase